MCGLIWIKRKDGKKAYKNVLKRYRAQQHRGKEGYGYVAIQDNKVVSYKRAVTELEIIKLMEKEVASEILFHHRLPTSTPNLEETAHPIKVSNHYLDHEYFFAHNGVIRNTEDLKKEHEKLGFRYNTELLEGIKSVSTGNMYVEKKRWNDSESLAIESALVIDGRQKAINTKGPAAVIGLKVKGDVVVDRFFYRNTMNPLCYHEDNVMIAITSLGKGNFIPTTFVHRLKHDGGYEVYGGEDKISTPIGYEYERKDDATIRYWDEQAKTFKTEDNHTLYLPAVPSNREDMRKLDDILKDIEKIPFTGFAGRFNIIKRYDDTTLWEEYDKTVGGESILKEQIQTLEDSSSDYVDDTVIRELSFLRGRLDKVKKYMNELSDEINLREASMSKV